MDTPAPSPRQTAAVGIECLKDPPPPFRVSAATRSSTSDPTDVGFILASRPGGAGARRVVFGKLPITTSFGPRVRVARAMTRRMPRVSFLRAGCSSPQAGPRAVSSAGDFSLLEHGRRDPPTARLGIAIVQALDGVDGVESAGRQGHGLHVGGS